MSRKRTETTRKRQRARRKETKKDQASEGTERDWKGSSSEPGEEDEEVREGPRGRLMKEACGEETGSLARLR